MVDINRGTHADCPAIHPTLPYAYVLSPESLRTRCALAEPALCAYGHGLRPNGHALANGTRKGWVRCRGGVLTILQPTQNRYTPVNQILWRLTRLSASHDTLRACDDLNSSLQIAKYPCRLLGFFASVRGLRLTILRCSSVSRYLAVLIRMKYHPEGVYICYSLRFFNSLMFTIRVNQCLERFYPS